MITTEFGKMEVKPNEICIIQVNICYKQVVIKDYESAFDPVTLIYIP